MPGRDELLGLRMVQHEGDHGARDVLVIDAHAAQRQQHGHDRHRRQPEKQCTRGLLEDVTAAVAHPGAGGGEDLQQHAGALLLVHAGHQRQQRVSLRIGGVGPAVKFRIVPRDDTGPGQHQGRAVGAEVVEHDCGVHSRSVGILTPAEPLIFFVLQTI
ncbi:hypothetical protein Ntsu_57960 [Nocardia sp. IFM 10818]